MACNCHQPDHDCSKCRSYATVPFTGLERYGPPDPYALLVEQFAKAATEPKAEPVHICRNCRFFVAAPAFGGFCHRHAPVFVGEGIAKPEAWPFLSGEDFCGEWEAGVTE